ncbi:hypothetical protein CHT98_07565 (plasmid) [Azospirillum brasilense]|uniref:Secreted protein n=1 Tax=Azospirillum brasilense TaxID=192 RepID=A0A235HG08_AZOBR|nr:hypothetical protein CHT98_07565 [Azospirillum brasilense]
MTTCFTWLVVVIAAARLPVIPSSAGGVAYSDCGGGGHKGGGLARRPGRFRLASSSVRPPPSFRSSPSVSSSVLSSAPVPGAEWRSRCHVSTSPKRL